jgi:rubrerythrin
MGIMFNAEEILAIAEQIERNGGKFYMAAAEKAETEEHRKLLSKLADMEAEHERTFAEMKKNLTPKERESKDMEPSNDTAAYLRAVADGNVFDYRKDPSKLLTGEQTMEDIFAIALSMEKESVVFYTGIKAMVPERLGSTRVDDIIAEEFSHITLLSKQLAEFKG